MIDEIAAAMARMGVAWTPELQEPTNGDESFKPKPLTTATTVLRAGLLEDEAWRKKYFKLDETHHPKVQKLATWGEWFLRYAANNNRTKGAWLAIGGPPGVGKTHVAQKVYAWLACYAIDLWQSGKWHKVPRVAKWDWPRIVEDDSGEIWEEALNGINGMVASDIVVLDDVGAEVDRFKSEMNKGRLRSAMNACEGKWLLMNTNIEKADWETQFGVRGADRLRAAHYLDMTGVPSYRPKLRGGKL